MKFYALKFRSRAYRPTDNNLKVEVSVNISLDLWMHNRRPIVHYEFYRKLNIINSFDISVNTYQFGLMDA